MIKIAFFDVDGTLLKMGHKELSERTLHALTSLHQNGVKLCMATGRGYLSAPRFPGIDFDALLTFNSFTPFCRREINVCSVRSLNSL